MATGPIPMNNAARRLRGETRPVRTGPQTTTLADIPAEQLGAARMPAFLGREARRFWRQYAPQLAEKGLLTAMDEQAFAMLCASWSDWRRVSEELRETGSTYTGARGRPVTHPLVRVRADLWAMVLQGMKDFGLTPASRGRLHVQAPTPKDAFSEWLDRKPDGGAS